MNPFASELEDEQAESNGLLRGVTSALVTDNRDEQGMGRVKLRFPWNKEEESDWARVCAPMAGNGRGAWFLPEIGDEVLVAFERGDPRVPYVIGALWNGKDAPPADNKDGENRWRRIRTRHGHELTFDDGGEHAVELKTKDGKHLYLDDQKIELGDGQGNELLIESSSGALTVRGATSIKLEAKNIELQANGELVLTATGTITIQGTAVRIN